MVSRPAVPSECKHNAHIYYILLAPGMDREEVLDCFRQAEIHAVFHYIPLHTSPAGQRFARTHGTMQTTISCSERLIRLPLWVGMTTDQQDRVVDVLEAACRTQMGTFNRVVQKRRLSAG